MSKFLGFNTILIFSIVKMPCVEEQREGDFYSFNPGNDTNWSSKYTMNSVVYATNQRTQKHVVSCVWWLFLLLP